MKNRLIQFQSTLPRGERRIPRRISYCPGTDFNPRSREGSDECCKGIIFRFANFNPRSREGSDQFPAALPHGMYDFNPRSREGSDNCEAVLYPRHSDFNPRSREGSDSSAAGRKDNVNHDFNPRSREGSDPGICLTLPGCMRFQSTLPRGERLSTSVIPIASIKFQSTLPRGERPRRRPQRQRKS